MSLSLILLTSLKFIYFDFFWEKIKKKCFYFSILSFATIFNDVHICSALMWSCFLFDRRILIAITWRKKMTRFVRINKLFSSCKWIFRGKKQFTVYCSNQQRFFGQNMSYLVRLIFNLLFSKQEIVRQFNFSFSFNKNKYVKNKFSKL